MEVHPDDLGLRNSTVLIRKGTYGMNTLLHFINGLVYFAMPVNMYSNYA